jgi:hypothetical protein
MSQAEARSWWADVEHLREAAERRQSADAERRVAQQRSAERRARAGVAPADPETARARARAATRVLDESRGSVDELSARRAVVLDERAPRARPPAPIWLADDVFADPVATARARASAPRRTIEIRGQVAMPAAQPRVPAPRRQGHIDAMTGTAVARRERRQVGLAASFATHPDRIAFWAFAMGLLLAIVAATSGSGA